MTPTPGYSTGDLRYDYYTIIPRPDSPAVLLLPTTDGWTLPHFELPETRLWQDVDHLGRALREHIGLETAVLRCVALDYTPQVERVQKVYAVENRQPGWQPPSGGRWFERPEVDQLPLAVPQHRAALADWFAWSDTRADTPLRAPWFRPGWFESATRWIDRQLQSHTDRRNGPIEQVRSWQRSAILRAPTEQGGVYLKAVPAMFAHEPRLTQHLAAAFPDQFPPVLAIDAERGLLLMRTAGERTLAQHDEIEVWEAALQRFAELQIACAGQVEQWSALGCPLRPLDDLASRIDRLCADTSAMLPQRPAGLPAAQIARLQRLVPRLHAMCRRLATFELPYSLEHGDFWAGQVVVDGPHFRFIDWSDSSIAHPFFSMLFFLAEVEDFFPRMRDVRARLTAAYLAPWQVYAAPETLIAAFELAQPLAALHHAITYQQFVLPNMELKWEMELMPPFYLKLLLRLMPEE